MRKVLTIYGPTATGKTAIAIDLAKKFSAEIVSADSRQVYKGLDIGTGKVDFDSKVQKHDGYWIVDGIRINGFDLVNPGVQFTVADFLQYSQTSLIRIGEAKRLPIVVGGTGFYIKALIDGIDSIGVPADQKLRQKLEKLSTKALYQKLTDINQSRANSMNQSDRANPRRLIRAIEIALNKDKLNTVNREPTTENYLLIGLTAPNEYLYRRADKWLEARLKKGMIDEVRGLVKRGIDPNWLDNLGLEYRWLTRLILGKITKDQAVEKLRGDIHSFIRRQKTWFSKFPNNLPAGRQVKLYDISKPNWRSQLEKTLKDLYTKG